MRLAQRKAQLESTREQEEDVEGDEETQEREVKEGHERFARMFEGIEDSSSEEDGGDDEDDAAQVGGKVQGLQLSGGKTGRGDGEADKEGIVVV
jgi:SIT4-associating protein SAP185/190